MDFFLGIIIGVTGYAIATKFNQYREEAIKSKVERQPKKIVVKDENDTY